MSALSPGAGQRQRRPAEDPGFVTLGGLPKGIAMGDVLMGVSVPRNRRLANIFYRLHLIEAFGTRMLKIKACYADCSNQPAVEVSENAFKIGSENAVNGTVSAGMNPPKGWGGR